MTTPEKSRALVFDASGRLLLGIRADGLYGLPGGHAESGEHSVDTVLREVEEETGLTQFDSVSFLFNYSDNAVFLLALADSPMLPQPSFDPDHEFMSFAWFHVARLPDSMDEVTESITYKWLMDQLSEPVQLAEHGGPEEEHLETAGVIEVLVDGEKVYELDDDTIWQTLPRLAQERAKGKKVSFRQVLDDGTVVDQTPVPMPVAAEYENSYWVGWPVWIGGDEYHLTLKSLGDTPASYEQIRDMLSDLNLQPTSLLTFTPDVFREKSVLRITNHPESWLAASECLEELRPNDNPFEPHITVPRTLWNKIKAENLGFERLGFEMGPLQVKQGSVLLGEIISDQKASSAGLPVQLRKAYAFVDEILTKYMPEEHTRPSLAMAYLVDYFAKTTYHSDGNTRLTQIIVNNDIVNNDEMLRQVLAHEAIHHHIYQKYGLSVDPHSDEFDEIAARINAVEGANYVTQFANDTQFVAKKSVTDPDNSLACINLIKSFNALT